jgi:tagaturonate epimerase
MHNETKARCHGAAPSTALRLAKYSVGVGDRFGLQAEAQLRACLLLAEQGVEVIPVWNKSNREHLLVGSAPADVLAAAAAAVAKLGWDKPWHVDADHIRLDTVDRFIAHSDFYTIDVADSIGRTASAGAGGAFAQRHPELSSGLSIAGIDGPLTITGPEVEQIAGKYLAAVREAGGIYRHIAQARGEGTFITEVSMDETDQAQTPVELLVILAALADEGVAAQTIAPKFTGRFNKGVDYAGDLERFGREFNDDLAVIRFAVNRYRLPDNLKLSIHSGSDKFSLYPVMAGALRRHNAGLHLKTAGTTWLEEVIGLAESGGSALDLAKEIYGEALPQINALCAPYATVIDIDPKQLPSAQTVLEWSPEQFAGALRHNPSRKEFNPHFRQLLHVAYKLAAQRAGRYQEQVRLCQSNIARNVTHNLLARHLQPLFVA